MVKTEDHSGTDSEDQRVDESSEAEEDEGKALGPGIPALVTKGGSVDEGTGLGGKKDGMSGRLAY